MGNSYTVMWRRSRLGAWHAWRVDEDRSVCKKLAADRATTEPEQLMVDDGRALCWHCRRIVGVAVKRADPPRTNEPDEMMVEFIGGPYDGRRMVLMMLRDGMRFRVLSGTYRFPEPELAVTTTG